MKNIIIAILAIALCISGYFNYQDSKAFKIRPGKDVLEITFYGDKIIKDTSSVGDPKGFGFAPHALMGSVGLAFPDGSMCNPKLYICTEIPPGGTTVIPKDLFPGYINLTELIQVFRKGDPPPIDTLIGHPNTKN